MYRTPNVLLCYDYTIVYVSLFIRIINLEVRLTNQDSRLLFGAGVVPYSRLDIRHNLLSSYPSSQHDEIKEW